MIFYRYDPYFYYYCGVFEPMPHQINDTEFENTTTIPPPNPVPLTIIKYNPQKQQWYYEEAPKDPSVEMNPMDQILDYKALRKLEYPDLTDYVDGVVKNDTNQIQEYVGKCLKVKQNIPKTVTKTRRQYLVEKIGMVVLPQNRKMTIVPQDN